MDQSSCEVVIIGLGLGAVAIANQQVQRSSVDIIMLFGAGCARFKHLDGGVIEPGLLDRAFGQTHDAPIHQIGDATVFRRDQLEVWALNSISGKVRVIEDFEEARVLPSDSGKLVIADATGQRSITANGVVLTEGANPKIGIAAGLREDFEPEDLIHFGRTIVQGASVRRPITGSFRTSWGMPAWYSVIPHPDGAIVGLAVRIENVMRAGQDGREVLRDFIKSSLAEELGIKGTTGQVGMELVPLRASSKAPRIVSRNIAISPDANGTIDARQLNRFNSVITAGMEMGAMLSQEWPNLPEWDEMSASLWHMFDTARTPYHDEKQSGYIEDGAARKKGLLQRLVNR